MWIFTPFGFFSATAYQGDKDSTEPEIQVRARAKEDLKNLIKRHFKKGDDKHIYSWKGRDYPYRVILPQRRWVEISAEMAKDIDYSNFKDEVKKEQGEDRAHIYMSVWSIMNGLERKLKDEARIRTARAKQKWIPKLMGAKGAFAPSRDKTDTDPFPPPIESLTDSEFESMTDAELEERYPLLWGVNSYEHGRGPKKSGKG